MLNFIKMKRNEWKIKAVVFGAVAALLDNQKNILELLQKLYIALKDIPADDLREEFISKLAEIIHAQQESVESGQG